MKIEVLVIVLGALILARRIVTGETSAVPSEVVLATAAGIACGLQPVQRPGEKAALTAAAFGAASILFALLFVAPQIFALVPSVAFVTYGFRGLASGRIVLSGRVGPAREHTGAAAYVQSAICVATGAFFIGLAFQFQ